MREFFDFLFTLKRLMTDKNKCPSYKGACLLEVIFDKNPPLNHWKVSAVVFVMCNVNLKKYYCTSY